MPRLAFVIDRTPSYRTLGAVIEAALAEMRERYLDLRRAVLACAPSGDRMTEAYQRVIQDAIAEARA